MLAAFLFFKTAANSVSRVLDRLLTLLGIVKIAANSVRDSFKKC